MALRAFAARRSHEARFGNGNGQSLVSPSRVLASNGLPKARLEELVLRGDVMRTGATNRKLGTLLKSGGLAPGDGLDPDAWEAIQAVLRERAELVYSATGKDLSVPSPRMAVQYKAALDAEERQRAQLHGNVVTALAQLDELVLDAYGVTNTEDRELICAGLPWGQ